MREAWKRQVREAISWKKNGRGLPGAVLCEMKALGIALPKLAGFEDGGWKSD